MARELRPPVYIRYVDDFVLFAGSKSALGEMKASIEGLLDGLRLRIHEGKSRVYRCRDGVTFLGWRLFPGYTRLVRGNVARFRRRLRAFQDAWEAGEMSKEDVRDRIRSWIGHAAGGDTVRLRERLFAQFDWAMGSAV